MELTPHDARALVAQLSSGVLGQCQATLPSGRPCPGVLQRGTTFCALHGGKAIHPALRATAIAILEARLTSGTWTDVRPPVAPAPPATRQAAPSPPSAPQPPPLPPGTVVLSPGQAQAVQRRTEAAEARVRALEAREHERAVALFNEGVRERAKAAALAEKRRILSLTDIGRKALARIDAEARARQGAR